MKTTKEQIEVMQAFEDGKTIQYRLSPAEYWADINIPSWNWSEIDYRVKPEKSQEQVDRESVISEMFAEVGVVRESSVLDLQIAFGCLYEAGCRLVGEKVSIDQFLSEWKPFSKRLEDHLDGFEVYRVKK